MRSAKDRKHNIDVCIAASNLATCSFACAYICSCSQEGLVRTGGQEAGGSAQEACTETAAAAAARIASALNILHKSRRCQEMPEIVAG